MNDTQSLALIYGFLTAGVAFALQDVLKNFAGGLIIVTNKIYSVGDRVELNAVKGDVLDIGIFYTTILEIRNWVEGDQATGRITTVPNNAVLSSNVHNFTKDHDFIWDEITLPISYNSDWRLAEKLILSILKEETAEYEKKADKDISKLEERYYFTKRPTEPQIFIKLTDNWVVFNIRYITEVRSRRKLSSDIARRILDTLNKNKIKIATGSLEVHLKK